MKPSRTIDNHRQAASGEQKTAGGRQQEDDNQQAAPGGKARHNTAQRDYAISHACRNMAWTLLSFMALLDHAMQAQDTVFQRKEQA